MSTAVADSRTALVEGLMARFPHVPREAVLKEDLLRTGIRFDESALTDNLDGEVKPKSYFIFSFDQKPLAELGERQPGFAVQRHPDRRRRVATLARVGRDRTRRAAADARVLPAHARERED